MFTQIIRWVCFVLCLASVGPVWAQEGHPLAGTWRGDWGPSADHRNAVTVVMSWDGENVNGILNPGPVGVPLHTTTFNPSTWEIRFEVEVPDQSGNLVLYIVEGKFENYGSLHHQQIIGSWSHAGAQGDFEITLQ